MRVCWRRGRSLKGIRELTHVPNRKAAELPGESFAQKNFKLIGEGIEGRIYSDGKLAYKFTNVVKDRDEAAFVEKQRREAIDNIKAVGNLGVGPRVYSISKDASAYSMDLLVGYEEGLSPFSIGSKEERPYSSQFINHLKTLEKDGRAALDIKEDNVMFNPKTKDLILIDQGHTKKMPVADRAKLLLDPANSRPLANEVISTYINKYGSKAETREYKKLQKQYETEVLLPDPFSPKPKPKTEGQSKVFIDRLFAIVDKVNLPKKKVDQNSAIASKTALINNAAVSSRGTATDTKASL